MQFFTNFEEYTPDAAPSDWTERWNTSFADAIVRDTGLPAGSGAQALEIAHGGTGGASGRYATTWDEAGSVNGDVQTYHRTFLTSITSVVRAIVICQGGAAGSEDGYIASVEHGSQLIARLDGGSISVLASSSSAMDTDEMWNVRFDRTGNDLSLTWWMDSESEPSPQLSTSDSTHSSGNVGIYSQTANLTWFVDRFGVGTGGDPAPTSADTGIELAGDIDIVTEWSGALTVQRTHELAGDIDIVTDWSGTLAVQRTIDLAGAIDIETAWSGQLQVGREIELSGEIDVVTDWSGALTVQRTIDLAGEIDVVTTWSGDLSVRLTPSEPLGVLIPLPGYTITVRDWQTLDVVGRIGAPQSATWTHRLYTPSDFRVTFFDLDTPMPGEVRASDVFSVTATGELAAIEHVVEIRRGGDFEFAGLIDHATLDDATGRLTISGLSLLSAWLSGRIVIPPDGETTDAQESAGAGAAIQHYVENHLIAPTVAARDVDSELSGVTFAIGPVATGNTITYRARYVNLQTAVQALSRIGDVIPVVRFNTGYTRYVLDVLAPVDRTFGTADAAVFGAERGTGEVTFVSDRLNHANALTVLGQGEGAGRTRITRTNADDLTRHRRREAMLDARQIPTKARLRMTGNPSADETVTIDGITYTYKASVGATADEVLIGADRDESLQNLRQAIVAGDGAGTLYGSGTTANSAVFAGQPVADILEIAASGTVTPVTLDETLAAGSWSQSSISLAALQSFGDDELTRRTAAAKSILVRVNLGRIRYRDDFALGDDVTAVIDRLGVSFDRRITEVAVAIDDRSFETVHATLGEPPSTLPQRLAGALSSINHVLAE